MMFQLEEERKVTANLSRTLELEKRKVSQFTIRTYFNVWDQIIHTMRCCRC